MEMVMVTPMPLGMATATRASPQQTTGHVMELGSRSCAPVSIHRLTQDQAHGLAHLIGIAAQILCKLVRSCCVARIWQTAANTSPVFTFQD